MAKGYESNKEHREQVASFGKALGKRAGFRCEWCGSREDLRPWEFLPGDEPTEEILALLCHRCRTLAEGSPPEPAELHTLRAALWSDIPAVAGGAGKVLVNGRVPWARDTIEESIFDENLRRLIFGEAR